MKYESLFYFLNFRKCRSKTEVKQTSMRFIYLFIYSPWTQISKIKYKFDG